MWSHPDRKVRFGGAVVLRVWLDGQLRLPLACRVWRKGGVATDAWALALLPVSEWQARERERLQGQPHCGLCDACYPSQTLLQRSRDDGWDGVCPWQQPRGVAGRA